MIKRYHFEEPPLPEGKKIHNIKVVQGFLMIYQMTGPEEEKKKLTETFI